MITCHLLGDCCAAQVLTKLAGDMWLATASAYKAGDVAGVAAHGARLLQLLLDMDELLASVPCVAQNINA